MFIPDTTKYKYLSNFYVFFFAFDLILKSVSFDLILTYAPLSHSVSTKCASEYSKMKQTKNIDFWIANA